MDELNTIIVLVPVSSEREAEDLARDVLAEAVLRTHPADTDVNVEWWDSPQGQRLSKALMESITVTLLQIREEAKLRAEGNLPLSIEDRAQEAAADTVRLLRNYARMLKVSGGELVGSQLPESAWLSTAAEIVEKEILGKNAASA